MVRILSIRCDRSTTLFTTAILVACVSLFAAGSATQPDVAHAQSASLVDGSDVFTQYDLSVRLPEVYETGVASTYGEGDGFEGNLTACGQVFHTEEVQVAHKSLPCGTLVRIVDDDTGLSVDAEVTDRGPYIAGRIVDLSWAAFSQLDPTAPGLLNVSVYVLNN